MLEAELVAPLTQFGMAGLIAWMWLTERRQAATRERQLAEAHERLMEQRVQLEQLIQVVQETTRAATTLEQGQRRLIEWLERGMAAPEGSAARRVG